ncbi:MAG: YqjK family protein [Sulfuricella sp.]
MRSEQRLVELSRRRAELVARSAAQRAELGELCHVWRVPLAIADRGVTVWRFLRVHPALLVGLGVAFAVARPRRAVKWLGRGWA